MFDAPAKALPGVVRTHNAAVVLQQLRLHAPLSRADLAKRIGLNRSTVSSIVMQLIHAGLIQETELQTDKLGRPGLSLALNPLGGCAVGVEADVAGVRVVLTDFTAQSIWRRSVQVDAGEPQESYLHCAEEMVRQALFQAQVMGLHVLGVGVALPGLVDVHSGELRYAPSLHWHDLPFRSRWSKRFGLPVLIENNANAAALGEYYFGVAQNVPNFLYIGAGATLGGGIVIKGELLRGRGGYAGEMGHMTLDPKGALCSCGRQGCWETLVGPEQVAAQYRRRSPQPAQRLKHEIVAKEGNEENGFAKLVAAANQGDLAAEAVMHELGQNLGIGIANLVNIFNPQLVVLGGYYSMAHETVIPMIKEMIKRHSLFPMRTALSVLPSQRGVDDRILGAVALILDDRMRAPV
jgi:predicted NBD/HSP70 family sugar kinase